MRIVGKFAGVFKKTCPYGEMALPSTGESWYTFSMNKMKPRPPAKRVILSIDVKPVYSTSTPAPKPVVREHLMVVEMESDFGGRTWSKPMPESAVDAYILEYPEWYGLSDVCCAYGCWCSE